MIRFKLLDENDNYKEYVIELDFENSDDFFDFIDTDEDYDDFMHEMECGHNPWCGVHDGTGGIDKDGTEWDGFHSYEIKDFDAAIERWSNFFKNKKRLLNLNQ
jgi:hypothetical protein